MDEFESDADLSARSSPAQVIVQKSNLSKLLCLLPFSLPRTLMSPNVVTELEPEREEKRAGGVGLIESMPKLPTLYSNLEHLGQVLERYFVARKDG